MVCFRNDFGQAQEAHELARAYHDGALGSNWPPLMRVTAFCSRDTEERWSVACDDR